MVKYIPVFLFMLMVLGAAPLSAQDLHSFQWRYESELGANMRQFDVLTLPDRGYVCAGLLENPAGSAYFYPCLYRVDCQGQVLWAKIFNEATESANNVSGRVLRISETDFVFVGTVGFYFISPYNDIFLARVNGEGNAVWTRRIGGGTNNQDVAQSATVTSDGNIVVAGQTGSFGTDANTQNNYTDQYFLKIDPDGNILWTRTVGNAQKTDRAFDIIELPDHSLVAAGSYIHTGGTFYANLLKMDQNGNVLWHRAYGDGAVPHANHAYGVLHTADQGFLITGSSTNVQADFTSFPDHLVIKTDAEGVPQWSRVIAGGAPNSFENAVNAVQTPDGNFAVMCATASYPTIGFVGNKYAIINLSPPGALLSARTYNLGSSHYPRIVADPYEEGYLIQGYSNWTNYGGNGNRFDPILINLDLELGVNGCFTADYTPVTTLFNPAFDYAEAVPGTSGSGGAIVSNLMNVSDFDLIHHNLCETDGYADCAPFTPVHYPDVLGETSIFPNPAPAGSSVSLRWPASTSVETVRIFDVNGVPVQTARPAPGTDNVEIRLQQAGIYWVRLDHQGGRSTLKLIVH